MDLCQKSVGFPEAGGEFFEQSAGRVGHFFAATAAPVLPDVISDVFRYPQIMPQNTADHFAEVKTC